jgi:hypothetical protein
VTGQDSSSSGNEAPAVAPIAWQQGDVALDATEFIHVRFATPRHSGDIGDAVELFDAVPTTVRGLVVLTQTCELVRPASERPYVEVAPLVESLDEAEYRQIECGLRPRYALLPSLRERRLVADLDRVMTMEKEGLCRLSLTRGLLSEGDDRSFRLALARKRSRAAFPDDFVALADPFQKRLKEKHNRRSAEGAALNSVREIRVRAFPDWSSEAVEVFFWFVTKDDGTPETDLETQVKKWMALLTPTDRFIGFAHRVTTLTNMSARDYVGSDRLDLDHLTTRSRLAT